MKNSYLIESICVITFIHLIINEIISFYLKRKYPDKYTNVHGIMVKQYLKYWFSIIRDSEISFVIKILSLTHLFVYGFLIILSSIIFIIIIYSFFI